MWPELNKKIATAKAPVSAVHPVPMAPVPRVPVSPKL